MKKIRFALSGLSLLACAATATAADESKFPVCISFAPAGFCDGMEFDAKTDATWHSWDCAGSQAPQSSAKYKGTKAHTVCDGAQGCNPAVAYGYDSLVWRFNLSASTGTLIVVMAGQKEVFQDIPVAITEGACDFSRVHGGVSSLAR